MERGFWGELASTSLKSSSIQDADIIALCLDAVFEHLWQRTQQLSVGWLVIKYNGKNPPDLLVW